MPVHREEFEAVGVITARGGSKSMHKKSITPCAGRPLMYYTLIAAKRSANLNRLVVSTDDDEIADVARAEGVEVLGKLPLDLLRHDIAHFTFVLTQLAEEGYSPDILVHLRPTTPLKKTNDIDRGVELLAANTDADSVRSVCRPMHSPFKMYREGERFIQPLLQREYPEVFAEFGEPYNMPRQILPMVWRHSGYVDVVRPSVIRGGSMSGTNILPMTIEEWRDVDIDSVHDLRYAEMIIEDLRAAGKNPWD
jgi:CMP-N,N'-diacetyllegionaminic acid synthase